MRLGATGQTGESFWRALFPGSGAARRTRSPSGPTSCSRRFKLDAKRDDFAGTLSGGQRKLLEMARALMVEPELVMLDEPMAGVNPALTQSLLGHVKDLREEGMTVLFVEHDMDMVRDISDWVIVMAQGKVIAEGPPDAVMADTRVIDAYLGAHHDSPSSKASVEAQIEREAAAELAAEHGEAVPEQEEDAVTAPTTAVTSPTVARMSRAPRTRSCARDELVAGYIPERQHPQRLRPVRRDGELVGIIGPNGAGKSTLLKAMFGLVTCVPAR